MHHDWPVKNATVDSPIRLREKRISGNSLSPLGVPEEGYRRYFADVTNRGPVIWFKVLCQCTM